MRRVEDPDEVVDLPAIGTRLAVSGICEGVELATTARLAAEREPGERSCGAGATPPRISHPRGLVGDASSSRALHRSARKGHADCTTTAYPRKTRHPGHMKPFIRVTEIWLPTEDRTALRYGSGLYGELSGFRTVSEATRFGFGEGLPGRAWAERRPIILKQLEGSYFRRGEAAREAGLTCGVALPIFAGDFLLAVVVFFCGGDYDHVGAIEIWMNDPAVSGQMARVDGYYGTAELFERDSGTAFGRGHGLPGQTWEAGVPVFASELYRATRVLRRGESALRVGDSTGIGLPFMSDPGRNWVMTFLSASGTPIARRFESWLVPERRDQLVRQAASGANPEPSRKAIARDEGALSRVLLTGLPFVSTDLGADSPLATAEIDALSVSTMVALPILTSEGRLASVAAWYF